MLLIYFIVSLGFLHYLVRFCLLVYFAFRGRVNDFLFFDCSSPFYFFKLNFIIIFPYLIKEYYIICINVVFRLGSDRPDFLFRAHFTFLNPHAYLLTFFCFFILCHTCRYNARVFGKTPCMSSIFPIAILMELAFFARQNSPLARASPIKI